MTDQNLNQNGSINPDLPADFCWTEIEVKERGAEAGRLFSFPAPKLQSIVENPKLLTELLTAAVDARLRYFARRELSASDVPLSLDKYFASLRQAGVGRIAGLREIKKLAGALVKALQKKSSAKFGILNSDLLVKCLESASFSEQLFPTVDQAVWTRCVDLLFEAARKNDVPTELLQQWADTRDEVDLISDDDDDDEGEFNLDELTV